MSDEIHNKILKLILDSSGEYPISNIIGDFPNENTEILRLYQDTIELSRIINKGQEWFQDNKYLVSYLFNLNLKDLEVVDLRILKDNYGLEILGIDEWIELIIKVLEKHYIIDKNRCLLMIESINKYHRKKINVLKKKINTLEKDINILNKNINNISRNDINMNKIKEILLGNVKKEDYEITNDNIEIFINIKCLIIGNVLVFEDNIEKDNKKISDMVKKKIFNNGELSEISNTGCNSDRGTGGNNCLFLSMMDIIGDEIVENFSLTSDEMRQWWKDGISVDSTGQDDNEGIKWAAPGAQADISSIKYVIRSMFSEHNLNYNFIILPTKYDGHDGRVATNPLNLENICVSFHNHIWLTNNLYGFIRGSPGHFQAVKWKGKTVFSFGELDDILKIIIVCKCFLDDILRGIKNVDDIHDKEIKDFIKNNTTISDIIKIVKNGYFYKRYINILLQLNNNLFINEEKSISDYVKIYQHIKNFNLININNFLEEKRHEYDYKNFVLCNNNIINNYLIKLKSHIQNA